MRDILCFMAIPLSKYKDKAGDQGGNVIEHLAKILMMPNNQAVNHWKNEIVTFITSVTRNDVKGGKKKYSYFLIPYEKVKTFQSFALNISQHPDYEDSIERMITGEELKEKSYKLFELLDADRLITNNDNLLYSVIIKNLDEALK